MPIDARARSRTEAQPAPMSSALAAALFAGLIVTAAGYAYAGYAAYSTFKHEKPPQQSATLTAPDRMQIAGARNVGRLR